MTTEVSESRIVSISRRKGVSNQYLSVDEYRPAARRPGFDSKTTLGRTAPGLEWVDRGQSLAVIATRAGQ